MTLTGITQNAAKRSMAVRVASAFAAIWGLVSIGVGAFIPSSGLALTAAVSGLVLVALALGVYRKSLTAAWCLAIFAVLDALARILTGQKGFLMPAILLIVSLWAVRYLKQHSYVETEAQTWTSFVYEFAFMQAILTLVLITWAIHGSPAEVGDTGFGLWNFIDVGALAGLGLAAYRRKMWAVYALLAYELLNACLALFERDLGTLISVRFTIVFLYAVAAFYIRRQGFPLPAREPTAASINHSS